MSATTYPAVMASSVYRMAGGAKHGTIVRLDAPRRPGEIRSTELWRCSHNHRLVRAARACAAAELERQRAAGKIRIRP